MAKKESLSIDDFDLDSDLNFDFDIGDIDGQINPETKKSKRSPVGDIVTGTISGAKSRVTDPNFIAKTIKDSLPKQYGEVFETTDKITSSLSSLYDETIREIKPELSRVAKKVDRLVPEESKFFKKLTSTFSKMVGNEFSDYKAATKEQIQEQSIANSLAAVFSAQNEIDAVEKAKESSEDKINKAVEQKRFTTNYQLLYGINQGINRLVQYNDKITQAYQKKSLELQFRSFFIQSELLDTSKRYFEVFKAQNEGIAKNTSLPEYVKIKDSERFKEAAKSKFIGSVQKGLFGDRDIVGTAMNRLKTKVKEQALGFKQGLEMGLMGLEEYQNTREQMEELQKMGVDTGNRYTFGGEMLGDTLSTALGQKLSKKIRESIPKDSPIARGGYKALDYIRNPQGKIEQLRDSEFMRQNRFGSGIKGAAASFGDFILDLFQAEKPDMVVKSKSALGDINDIAPGFTNKAIKSITDVIPGYLSRIHREILMIRKRSDNESLVVYDYGKDKFTTTTQLGADLKASLKTKADRSSYKSTIDQVFKNIISDKKLSTNPETQKFLEDELKGVIRKLSQETMDYTPKNILQSKAVKDSSVGPILRKFLNKHMQKEGGSDKNQSDLTKAFTDVRNATPDLRTEIETLVKAGYSDLLEEQGLIKRNDKGEIEIDFDQYNTLVSSDVNVKQGIKSINPKDALASVKKTRIYNWFYKLGKGDKKPHTGPMAQDVNQNLGEEAAPDGTKIDLTTMNGVNMAAIQALDDKVSKQVKGSKSDSYLAGIKKDTGQIVKLISGKGVSSRGKIKLDDLKEILEQRKGFYSSVVEPTINNTFEAFNKITTGIKSGFEFGRDNVASPFFKFVKESYDKNKDAIKDKLGNILKSGLDLASGALKFVTNTVPTNIKNAYSFLKEKAITVSDMLNGPIDIYSQKTKVPLLKAGLIKIGYYIDQTTGQVIKSVKDIKGPVVNRLGEVVLSIEDLAEGLVDKDGKSILTPFEKLAKAAIGYAAKGFKRVKNFYSNLSKGILPNKIKSWFKASETESLSGGKTYDLLVEIRDILKAKSSISDSGIVSEETEEPKKETEVNKPDLTEKYRSSGSGINFGSIASGIKNAKDKGLNAYKTKGFKGAISAGLAGIGSFFGSGTENTEQPQNQTTAPSEPQSNEDATDDKPSIKSRVKKVIDRSKVAWNDKDASGRRDGDWRDRLDAMKDKAKTKFQKADLTQRYRSSENILDTIFKKASGLFDMFKKGGSGVIDAVGSVLSGGIGKISKIGGLLKSMPGGLWKAGKSGVGLLGKGISAARSVGGPLVNALSKVKNVASVGRILSAGNAVRNIMMVGSLATGGLASTALGAASTAMTVLAGAIGSQVVLGAAAIAGTAYGAYRAYKYFTRDDINGFESIRIKQYGLLNSDKDKHHNHQLLQLEEYLQDGCIGYDRGKAYLLPKKVDLKEMLSIFDIDIEDTKQVDQFTRWFEHRFKPFFLTHVTALYSLNNKFKLKDVKDLSEEDRAKYLGLISFESGPYDVQVSPFKDIDTLNTDPRIAKSQIDYELAMLKDKIKGKSNKPKDAKSLKPEKQIETVDKKGGEQYILQPVREKMPNTNIASQPKSANWPDGEDGQKTSFDKTAILKTSAMSLGGIDKLNVAQGPVRDGQSGLQYANLQPGVSLDGLNPAVFNQFKAMIQEYGEVTGKSVTITSGYRSTDKQAELYRKDPEHAARPGRSMHEFGLALDVNSKDLDELDKLGLMRKYGFTRPVGGEPWHTEPAGIQVNIDKAKHDSAFATQAVEASLFKGGGGIGSIPNSPLRKRDTQLAIELMGLKDVRQVKSDKDVINEVLKPSNETTQPEEFNEQSGLRTASYQPNKSNVIPFSPRTTESPRSNVSGISTMGMSGGYASSVSNTFGQSESYSKNDSLFEPESKPGIGSGQIAVSKPPANKQEVVEIIQNTASKAGVDPKLMTAFAAVESGMNPNARAGTSSASGLFQFTKATWNEQLGKHGQKYGLRPGTSPFDATANTLMASEYVKSNLKTISSVKPNPNLTDAYMAHFLGAGGARRFLRALQTNPDAAAYQLFPKETAANPSIFKPNGRAATVRQVYEMLGNRLAQKAAAYGIDVGSMSSAGSQDYTSDMSGDDTGYSSSIGSSDTSSSTYSDTGAGISQGPLNRQSQTTYSGGNDYNNLGAFNTRSTTSTGQGQGFDIGGIQSTINHVGETLDKSLDVQQQMLSTLREILANANSGNMQQVQDGLKQVANQAKETSTLSKPAIDLSRKSA